MPADPQSPNTLHEQARARMEAHAQALDHAFSLEREVERAFVGLHHHGSTRPPWWERRQVALDLGAPAVLARRLLHETEHLRAQEELTHALVAALPDEGDPWAQALRLDLEELARARRDLEVLQAAVERTGRELDLLEPRGARARDLYHLLAPFVGRLAEVKELAGRLVLDRSTPQDAIRARLAALDEEARLRRVALDEVSR